MTDSATDKDAGQTWGAKPRSASAQEEDMTDKKTVRGAPKFSYTREQLLAARENPLSKVKPPGLADLVDKSNAHSALLPAARAVPAKKAAGRDPGDPSPSLGPEDKKIDSSTPPPGLSAPPGLGD